MKFEIFPVFDGSSFPFQTSQEENKMRDFFWFPFKGCLSCLLIKLLWDFRERVIFLLFRFHCMLMVDGFHFWRFDGFVFDFVLFSSSFKLFEWLVRFFMKWGVHFEISFRIRCVVLVRLSSFLSSVEWDRLFTEVRFAQNACFCFVDSES